MSYPILSDSRCDLLEEVHSQLREGYARSTAAITRAMPNVRPVLFRNNEGTLTTVAMVRNRRAALEYLAKKLRGSDPEEVFISHCGCPEDAQALEQMLDTPCKIKALRTSRLGPVIAVHTALGVLSVSF